MANRKMQEVGSDFAEPWNPENEGDKLEGEFIGVDLVPTKRRNRDGSKFFKSYRILPEGKEQPLGVSGAFLNTKMPRIPVGTFVCITYLGKTETDNGTAKDYQVECEAGVRLIDVNAEKNARDRRDSDIPF